MGTISEKNFRIYLRSTRQWVEVPEEMYKEHARFYNACRQRNQDRGECVCPREKAWYCDGDCQTCVFHRHGRMISLDSSQEDEDGNICNPVDVLAAQCSDMEEEHCNKEEAAELLERLFRLMPEAKEIGMLRLQGWTDEEIARAIGIKRPTFVKRLKSARDRLALMYPELLARASR